MAGSLTQTRTFVTSNPRLSTFAASAFAWHGIGRHILAWRHRSRSRQELLNLSDEVLQDIGVTRPTTTHEVVKPIWMP
jgi:uncharacterized protein YjiS (DUF1127 family)